MRGLCERNQSTTVPNGRRHQVTERIRRWSAEHDVRAPDRRRLNGKTYTFSYIADSAQKKNGHVMILAHRKELVMQASLSLASLGVEHSVIAPGNVVAEIKIQHVRELGACYVKPSAHVSVGSVQTIVRRLPSLHVPTLVIIDECFPAGTLVDGIEIQKRKAGDLIRSVNHSTGQIEMKLVLRVFKNKCTDICRVTFSNGKIIHCTPGHPFYSTTNKKYVSAFLLKEGECVASIPMQALRESCPSNNEMAKRSNTNWCGDILQHGLLEGILRSDLVQNDVENQFQICVWANESKESNEAGFFPREDERNASQDRTQAKAAGREWSRPNGSANTLDGTFEGGRVESGAGICTENWVSEGMRFSTGLQDRHCNSIDDDSDRGGRCVPQRSVPQGAGLEENGNPFCLRVERVEVYERESAGRYGDGFVYNLEVEGNHNYFVEDVLVHNCHHATAGQWRDIINYFPRARILGVTATPIRTDGQGLGTHVGGVFDAMVLGPTMRELIALGNLVAPKIYMPGTEIDLKGVRVTASGDYNSEQLNERLKTARPTIIGDAVEWYRKLAHGKRAVAFCASVGAAQATAKAFCDAGYKFVSLDGTMDNTERRRAVLMLNSGEIDGITSCDIVSEGFDCPGLEVAILLRPTHSEGLYLQQCLDEKTEVLTNNGWRLYHNITKDDSVAAFNMINNQIEWLGINRIIKRNLSDGESFYGIESTHLNIRVTGQHDMVYRNRSKSSWKKCKADDLSERKSMWEIPVSAISKNIDCDISDDDLKLLGWFLTDGTRNKKTNAIQIAQSSAKDFHCNEIRNAIKSCGFKFGECRIKRTGELSHCPDLILFSISYGEPRGTDKHLSGWRRLEKWIDKSIPKIYDTLSDRQFEVLISAMFLGDGSNQRKVSWNQKSMQITFGDNKEMADRMQAIAVTHGYKCNQHISKYENRSTWYELNLKKGIYSTVSGRNDKDGSICGKSFSRSHFKKVLSKSSDVVWCVENDLGTLITRRFGKVSIVGNCGRVLRPAPGKKFGIIIDHVGNVAQFGPPHWDREWSLDGGIEKRKSSASQEEQVLIRTCPKCFSVHDPAPKCPECGHVYVIKARKLDQKDGVLIELTPEMEAKMAMQKGKAKQQGRAQTIESLIRLAMTRGNDPAWAYHIFMSRDGNTAHDVKAGVERLLGELRGEIEANPLVAGELRANMTKIHQAYSYRLGKVGVALAPM